MDSNGMWKLSRTFSNHMNICANLCLGKDGSETVSGWALGGKVPLTRDAHGIAAGVELLGDFEGEFSVLGGFYFPIGGPNLICKTGIELGDGRVRVNGTLMYRF